MDLRRASRAAMVAAAALLVGVACGGDDEAGREKAEVLPALRSDEVTAMVPPGSTVLDRGELEACGGGSRSDGWAEVTWTFSSPLTADGVTTFYRSELPKRGWVEGDASEYGRGVILFRKAERQLRVYSLSNGERHVVIFEAPPNQRC